MNRCRSSLQKLLLFVTVFSAYFSLANLFDAWVSTTYDGYYVNSILAHHIKNGDSINTIASHFSSYRLLDDNDSHDMKNVTDIWTSNRRRIEKEDRLYHFGTWGGAEKYLQFRDDRLINLSNKAYRDEIGIAKKNPYPFPTWVVRFGFLALYCLLVSAGKIAILVVQNFKRDVDHIGHARENRIFKHNDVARRNAGRRLVVPTDDRRDHTTTHCLRIIRPRRASPC